MKPMQDAGAETLALSTRLSGARRVTVLTGAGISAASGVPTFRGPEGLWRQYRPEDLATASAFARDPKLVWEWYLWRRQRIARCAPNAAHRVLATWSRRFPEFRLITQNVDGLHERAGTLNVVRFHGSIWRVRCAAACPAGRSEVADDRLDVPDLPPRCPGCGGPLRPAVVWFGEPIPGDVLRLAVEATACDVFISVGTSSVVHPAASLIGEAGTAGAFTVEINPEPTPLAGLVDLCLTGAAEHVLPAADAHLSGGQSERAGAGHLEEEKWKRS